MVLSRLLRILEEVLISLKFRDDYDISPIFNVKDLRSYHGEDLRASLFAQLWVIDEGATTTCI